MLAFRSVMAARVSHVLNNVGRSVVGRWFSVNCPGMLGAYTCNWWRATASLDDYWTSLDLWPAGLVVARACAWAWWPGPRRVQWASVCRCSPLSRRSTVTTSLASLSARVACLLRAHKCGRWLKVFTRRERNWPVNCSIVNWNQHITTFTRHMKTFRIDCVNATQKLKLLNSPMWVSWVDSTEWRFEWRSYNRPLYWRVTDWLGCKSNK